MEIKIVHMPLCKTEGCKTESIFLCSWCLPCARIETPELLTEKALNPANDHLFKTHTKGEFNG